jgi:hypothetical protein
MAIQKVSKVVPGPVDRADDAPAPNPLGTADPRLSPGFLHTVSPDRTGPDGDVIPGEPVVFTPGELLPPFVLDALRAGATLAVEGPGHFRLVTP